MRKQYHVRFVLSAAAILCCGIGASAASAQDAAKLRYGYHMGEQYSYEVTLTADLPSEDLTDTGVLHYEVPASADGQFTLKCTGVLKSSTKPKADAPPSSSPPPSAGPTRGPRGPRGPRVGPRVAPPPRHFSPWVAPAREQQTTFDRQGKIVRQGDDPSLPFLLGRRAEFVVDQFPDEAKQAWNVERELGVVERNQSPGPSFGPFGRGGSETHHGAKERIDYAVTAQDDSFIYISKKYSLRTLPEEGVTRIDMSGEGELVFAKKQGVIASHKMKYQLKINEKNVSITIPYSVECRLLSALEAAAEQKKEAEEKKALEERFAKSKAEREAREKAGKAAAAADPSMRTWHAATGGFSVRAAFLSLESDSVTLKRADGRIIHVPLEKLSDADREYAKQQAKSKSEDPFQ
jgi:hypothetical protein